MEKHSQDESSDTTVKNSKSNKTNTTALSSAVPSGAGAMTVVFVTFIIISVLFAAANGTMEQISQESFFAAKQAVTLAIGLIGVMALWLGLVSILEESGFMLRIAKLLKPILVRLFPDVPENHPAMGSMVLNLSANMLGLGNAATPFGIRAMQQLNRLNPFPGTATNAMCLFLAMNTSSVTILPLGVISVRAAAGASDPAGIFLPTLLATLCSTIVGVGVALFFSVTDKSYRQSASRIEAQPKDYTDANLDDSEPTPVSRPYSMKGQFFFWGVLSAFLVLFFYRMTQSPQPLEFIRGEFFSFWLMPFLMLLIVLHGVRCQLDVYDVVTKGAKQGFEVAVKIIPYLVVILVAIGMFRASGAMEILVATLSPITSLVHLPAEVLPMALLRPLSGSGAFAVMSAVVAGDPNGYPAYVASVLQGSTETTFYVLAVYFGSVGIVKIRHALVAALIADFTGILAASFFSYVFFPELTQVIP